MKNLLVAVGNIDIPSSIVFDIEKFDVLHLPSAKNGFDKSSVFYNKPFLKDIVVLNRAGLLKADKEISTQTLYDKVVYVHLDYLILNQVQGKEWDISYPSISIVDNTLYSPINTVYPYYYKDLIIPSPTFWMCSSNTFNIISCISTSVLTKGSVKWNIEFDPKVVNEGIFSNYEIQFWNYLASMNINIKPL